MPAVKHIIILLRLIFEVRFSNSYNLFKVLGNSSEVCCQEKIIKSCVNIEVNSSLLAEENMIINGEVFKLSNELPHNGFAYDNDKGFEAAINYNEVNGAMFGHVTTSKGQFAIEKCEEDHVWKEFHLMPHDQDDEIPLKNYPLLKKIRSGFDNTTLVNISMMFYYTDSFASVTPNIQDFFHHIIAKTNQGFINSKIPLRVALHCLEKATINDGTEGSILRRFSRMKTLEELRHTADGATLFGKFCNVMTL